MAEKLKNAHPLNPYQAQNSEQEQIDNAIAEEIEKINERRQGKS